jgi:hypothetical protein
MFDGSAGLLIAVLDKPEARRISFLVLPRKVLVHRYSLQLLGAADKGAQSCVVILLEPSGVKQDMHVCRLGQCHERVKVDIETVLGKCTVKTVRIPDRTRYLECQ